MKPLAGKVEFRSRNGPLSVDPSRLLPSLSLLPRFPTFSFNQHLLDPQETMAKRFSLNLSLLPSPSSSSSLPLPSPSFQERSRQGSTSPASSSTQQQQQQQYNTEAGILNVQREDLHKQLRSLE